VSKAPLNGHIGKLFFMKTFLKDRNIAALTPTSPYAVQRILNCMDFTRDIVVVEYGPGTGAFTKVLLEKLSPKSKLVLIDTNPQFVSILKKVEDPRVHVFNESAENILDILKRAGAARADYILSGIPFSFFNKDLKMRIIRNTQKALGRDGRFLVYQYSAHVKKYLKQAFRGVNTHMELFHVPPIVVFEARP
jgi:phospholipid N-methyltransferase